MRTHTLLTGLIMLLLIAACSDHSPRQTPPVTGFQASDYFYPAPALDDAAIAVGQIIYVPVYSHVYLSGVGKRELATTLSIRNTDPDNPIIVQSVTYYGTDGKLLQHAKQQATWSTALGSQGCWTAHKLHDLDFRQSGIRPIRPETMRGDATR